MNIILIIAVVLLFLIYRFIDMYFRRSYCYYIQRGLYIDVRNFVISIKKIIILLILTLLVILLFRLLI